MTGEIQSSMVVSCGKHNYLIDCADGTLYKMKEMNVSLSHIDAIFISHMHSDHTGGMLNVLGTMQLSNRTNPLKVYAPQEYFDLWMPVFNRLIGEFRTFKAEYIPIDTTQNKVIFEDNRVTVTSIPLMHSEECSGFLFREKEKLPNIKIEEINKYGIPLSYINTIKTTEKWAWASDDGTIIPRSHFIVEPEPPQSFAYCSDTMYFPMLSTYVKGTDLIYHEASFSDSDYELAARYMHSTGSDAARTARDAKAKKLLLGHISARYKDSEEIVGSAKEIFPNTELAKSSTVYEISEL